MTKKKCFSAVFAKINQIKFIVYVPEGEEWIVAEIRRNKKRLPATEILRKDLDFVDVLMALFILCNSPPGSGNKRRTGGIHSIGVDGINEVMEGVSEL
jgi:hypothetical protein